MFTKFIDSNYKISNYLNTKIFNNHIECINYNIFNTRGISISGSTTLHLYNSFYTNNSIIDTNDIDIYIELNYMSLSYLQELFIKLFISGYRLSNKNNKSTKLHIEYNNFMNLLFKLFNPNKGGYFKLLDGNKYFSLSKYIYKIITIENIYSKQKLDLIFIKSNIKKLLLESFDFDIIKNYFSLGKLHIFNLNAIHNKIATMTCTHFKTRVIDNIYELNNFIIRYKKYKNRNYNIFIDNNQINIQFINNITKLLFILFHIEFTNSKLFLNSKLYIQNNASYMIYTYYINYFYINEQLMKHVYHPKNITKMLQFGLNIDDI